MVFAFFVEVLKIVVNFCENKLLAHLASVNHASQGTKPIFAYADLNGSAVNPGYFLTKINIQPRENAHSLLLLSKSISKTMGNLKESF